MRYLVVPSLFVFVFAFVGCGDGASGPTDASADVLVDGGAVSLDECFDGIAPSRAAAAFVQIQTLETEDSSVRLRIAVEPGDAMAVGETFAYELVRFGVTRDGETVCVTDRASLAYVWGHHNWNEVTTATVGADVYEVRSLFEFTSDDSVWADTLTVRPTAGGAASLDAVTLVEAGCRSIPYNYNPCFRRTRTDTSDL